MSLFSSALKSIGQTNINANYSINPTATSQAGPWRIHDAKRKSTGKVYSVFIFDKKSLDTQGPSLGRSGASAFKKVTEEVVERLRKEASSLAKLRHPSILELVEPVEDTRGGGLQFVTEPVTASLASLLQEKDDEERAGGVGGRPSRFVREGSDGTRRRREIEIDELEIQKGLLQISKALEFLHENAGLVHGNITPDAILVNAKVCRPAGDSLGLQYETILYLTSRCAVGLEDQRPVLLQSSRKLHETNVVPATKPLRDSQPRSTATSLRAARPRLFFTRLCSGQQPQRVCGHVLPGPALYRPLQLTTQISATM